MSEFFDAEVYESVLDNLTTGVCVVDPGGRIRFWNDGAERITGHLRQGMIGLNCDVEHFMHRDETNTLLTGANSPLFCAMHNGRTSTADLFLVHKEGECLPVRIRTAPIRNAHGTILGAAEYFDPLSLIPEADVYSHLSGTRDPLTGILDEASFDAYLASTIEDFHKNCVPYGVLTLAIDQLDDIRHHQGVAAAQATLRATAHTLSRGIGPFDAVGRRNEDVFTAIVTPCPAAHLEAVAAKFQRIVGRTSIPWWGDHISITVSVGGTAARDQDTTAELLHRSKEALAMDSPAVRRVHII